MTVHHNHTENINMSKLEKLKLFALGGVWFVLGGVYSLTAYAVGQYTAQLF